MMPTAFAPAHVSGLFAVHDEAPDPIAKGSRGAGWCLDLGATATVAPGTSGVAIRIDGRPAVANVTRLALHKLAPEAALDVDIHLDLPVGQGFGMSAAGTLAATLAASNLLGLDPDRALEAAHAAEVESGTGLGDAVGSWQGGAEVRVRPGVPPAGHVLRVDPPTDTVFLHVVAGDPIPTPGVVRDPAWAQATRLLGDAAVDRIVAAGRSRAWAAILEESARFSLDLGLMPEAVRALGRRLPPGILWGQAMLGSTLWATGPAPALEEAERILRSAGPVLRAGVDAGGARLVKGR
jgi:pantoate kinase